MPLSSNVALLHKIAHILNKLLKRIQLVIIQSKATQMIDEIYISTRKFAGLKAYEIFFGIYDVKYHKAYHCLKKDKYLPDKQVT